MLLMSVHRPGPRLWCEKLPRTVRSVVKAHFEPPAPQ